MSDVSRNIFLNTVAELHSNDKTAGVIIGGWRGKDSDRRYPSGVGVVSSGFLADAADDLYAKRRAEGRGVLRSALGYLNAPMGAVVGGIAGVPLAPLTFGLSIPAGAHAGAAKQIQLSMDDSPWAHVLPVLGGMGIGAGLGAVIGAAARHEDKAGVGAGAALGAGVGGLGGYALSRLMN